MQLEDAKLTTSTLFKVHFLHQFDVEIDLFSEYILNLNSNFKFNVGFNLNTRKWVDPQV